MTSDHSDVLSLFALFAGRGVELDTLTLFEALVTITLDAGEMYEDVVTLLARDEAESFVCVKKLHCSLCHEYPILDAADRPIPPARLERPYSAGGDTRFLRKTTRYPCVESLIGLETTRAYSLQDEIHQIKAEGRMGATHGTAMRSRLDASVPRSGSRQLTPFASSPASFRARALDESTAYT